MGTLQGFRPCIGSQEVGSHWVCSCPCELWIIGFTVFFLLLLLSDGARNFQGFGTNDFFLQTFLDTLVVETVSDDLDSLKLCCDGS